MVAKIGEMDKSYAIMPVWTLLLHISKIFRLLSKSM